MNILSITQECMERGKMTISQAMHLRTSVHTFIGATGTHTLDEIEFPAWVEQHCKKCDQTDCSLYKEVNK